MNTEIATKSKDTDTGVIPREWSVLNVGKIGRVVTGKTPPTNNPEYYGDDYPFVKIPDMTDSVYVNKTNTRISQKGADYLGKAKIPKNSIMVSCIATIGNVGITSEDSFTNQQINSLIPNKDVADFKYLYYFFKLNKELLESLGGGGSVYTNISKSKFESMPVVLPGIREQKNISEILSSLDDKIEFNQKINDSLEKLASILFKRWFIDFNFPNKEGKPYKSSGGQMVESELGEIPDGWQIRLMTDFVNIDKGLSYKGSDLNSEGKNLLVGLKCFERGGGFRADGTKRFAGEFKSQHLLNQGDLIVAMTDLTQGAEVLGKPAIVPNIKNAEHVVASLDVSILRPKTSQLSKAYLYTLFMRQETQDYLFGYSNGSTVLHLSIKGLHEFKLAIAPDDIFQKFNNIIEPIFNQIQILNSELHNLETVRDSLLPRLMTGKIRTN